MNGKKGHPLVTSRIDPKEEIRRLSRKLDSNYIRAYCEEWTLGTKLINEILAFYAEEDDPLEVLGFIAGVINAQRFKLIKAGKIIPIEVFLQDPAALPNKTDA